jgi:hypothetical protein
MKNPIIVTLLSFLFLSACSSIIVKSDYDPNVDFKAYKTYHWIDFENINDDGLAKNPLLRKRIIAAIDDDLKNKNFILKESDQVDFYVVVHGLTRENGNVTEWAGGYRYDPWWGPNGGSVDVSYYEQGTLVVDMVDAKANELIWRGLGTCVLRDNCDPENLQKAANKYVAKVLDEFPPNQK